MPLIGGDDVDVAIRETRELRDVVIPDTLAKVPGATVNTTGNEASSIDLTDKLKQRAPLVFAFVLTLAFLLLLITFRSIVVPIKAILLNLLSVAAAYGVLVTVFQHGWGHELIGFDPNGALGFLTGRPVFLQAHDQPQGRRGALANSPRRHWLHALPRARAHLPPCRPKRHTA